MEVNSITEEVCGIKKIEGNRNRGDAWWTNEVKEAVEKRKRLSLNGMKRMCLEKLGE